MATSDQSRPILAMCPPEHFGVQYEINPWMEGNIGRADTARARDQWDTLHAILTQRAEVRVMESAPHLPDMCFIANAGLVLDDVFVPSIFRVPQRAPEVPHFRRWFKEQDFVVENLSSESAFDGEGDALFHPRSHDTPLLWAGYGVRSACSPTGASRKFSGAKSSRSDLWTSAFITSIPASPPCPTAD